MKLNKVIAIPAVALAAGLGLAACSASAPAPVPTHTVTASPAPTTPAPTTSAPKVVVVTPAPAQTVYVPAPAPAAPASAGTNCGNDVYAGANTSCAFAQNVAAAYDGSGNSAVVYSPVTGESYTMTYTRDEAGDWVIATGGNDASVNFKLG